MEALSKEWFDKAFTDPTTDVVYEVPTALRRLSERICRSYGISGESDPMYIANITAFELGLGDGQSHFGDRSTWNRCLRPTLGADDLILPCALPPCHSGFCSTGR